MRVPIASSKALHRKYVSLAKPSPWILFRDEQKMRLGTRTGY